MSERLAAERPVTDAQIEHAAESFYRWCWDRPGGAFVTERTIDTITWAEAVELGHAKPYRKAARDALAAAVAPSEVDKCASAMGDALRKLAEHGPRHT